MRFMTPAFFFAVAGILHIYNPRPNGEVVVFPFMVSLLPSTQGDPLAQARATEVLIVLVGLLTLGLAFWRMHREKAALLDD
mgnify:CR=1 FL=1